MPVTPRIKAGFLARNLISALLLLPLAVAPGVWANGIYKWTDAEGKIHFTDKPPAGGDVEELQLNINTYGSQSTPVSPKAAVTDAGKGKQVVMYSTEWCQYCKKAREYFRSQNIAFREYDIEKSSKGRAEYKRLKGTGVPIILVGTQRMNGFSEDRFRKLWR